MTTVINARIAKRGIFHELQELWQFRSLIIVHIKRELSVRYKNSVIGVGWSLSGPIVQAFVLTFVIRYIMQAGPQNMSAYILCAFIPWTFFQTAVLDASGAVLTQLPLLKKVYFPREIPVIATVGANFINLLFSLAIFIVYWWMIMPFFHGWPGWPPIQFLWLPAIIAVEFFFVLGISFFVCAWNLFYEDVKFMVTVVMQFLFYLLPIIYFAENLFYSQKIPTGLRAPLYHAYLLNPLTWSVTAFRQVVFGRQPISKEGVTPIIMSAPFDLRLLAFSAVVSLVVCLWGYAYFNAQKWKFTERP